MFLTIGGLTFLDHQNSVSNIQEETTQKYKGSFSHFKKNQMTFTIMFDGAS